MSDAKRWLSAAELAGLPGLPGTKRGLIKMAVREAWESRPRAGRGGGKEYAVAKLPKAVREAIYSRYADAGSVAQHSEVLAKPAQTLDAAAVKALPAVPVARQKNSTDYADWQLKARDAAAILAREVMGTMALLGCTEKAACLEMAGRIERNESAAHVIQADMDANIKPRNQATAAERISARTRRLQRIMQFWRAGEMEGDALKYLIPGRREKEGFDPLHIAAFLRFFCNPGHPTVRKAHDLMCAYLNDQGIKAPSYTVATRIENSLPVTVKYRGRVTGAAWRALKPYIDRDVSMFKSNDIWVGDGHSFKARIQSPIHGQAFQPEVTVVIDWVSRKIVGWSVALSESTIAVSDAFRHAQLQTRARPLIYYSDNGSGQTGKKIDHPIFGSLARQGIGHETGIPGNPQGRGIIERLWPTVTIPLAKTYPTVLTKDADRDTVRKVTQLLAKAQRAGESSPILPSWPQFISDLEQAIEDYNAHHRHSGLKGMTPNQAYEAFLDQESIVFGVSDAEINELWMPEVERTPARGVVRLFGNEYYLRDLVDVLEEGEKVRVRYDIHNADQVWLWRASGEFVGAAKWNGNRVAAFPVSEMEQKRYERANGIKKRAQREIDRADAELGNTYDALPSIEVSTLPPLEITPAIEPAYITRQPVQEPKPNLAQLGDYSLLTWLADHPEDWNDGFRSYFASQARNGSRTISDALDEYGLWSELEKRDFKVAV